MKKKPAISIFFNIHFLLITIIALGTVAVLSVVNKPQTIAQYASSDVNLNTAYGISETVNPDRSMGPESASGNLSSSLPAGYLGEFKLYMRDSNIASSNDLEFLRLTLRKAETRLIYLFLPGTKRNSMTDKEIALDGRKTNQHVNKWETIFPTDSETNTTITINSEKNVPAISVYLAGGKYSELRMYIEKAEVKLKNGDIINLNITDKSGIIRILRPYSIYSGESIAVALDLDTKRSIIKSGSEYFFDPVVINAVSN